jgi:selenocysteine lyase/cysteine desulfurase
MITEDMVEKLRRSTPGCADGIHLNHAGASLPSQATVDAIAAHLALEARVGLMEAAEMVAEELEAARACAARLIGGKQPEIAFGTSGSASWGMAFLALPALKAGDRILVGRHEWGGSLATLVRAAEIAGATVETIPCREDGGVDAEALAGMIDERVRMVCLTWLPANGGLINDAAAVGRVAREAGVAYLVDAGQALGQVPVDVEQIGCDILAATCRKHLRGPRGTSLLYVRSSLREKLSPPFVDVRSAPFVEGRPVLRNDACMFETSEQPIALRLGLAKALHDAETLGTAATAERIEGLASDLRGKLAEVPRVVLRDLGTRKSGIVSFTMDGVAAQEVRKRLALRKIAIGANGIAYSPLDMAARGLTEIARMSVSYLNTTAEVEQAVEAVRGICLRR